VHQLTEGQCVAFDDSFQHEAWNGHPDTARVVLIVDVWHPDLTDPEVRALELMRSHQLRAAKAAASSGLLAPSDDFYAILLAAKRDAAGSAETDVAVFGADKPLPAGAVPVRDD